MHSDEAMYQSYLDTGDPESKIRAAYLNACGKMHALLGHYDCIRGTVGTLTSLVYATQKQIEQSTTQSCHHREPNL